MYKPGIGSHRAAGQIVSCMIHNCLILIRDRKVEKKSHSPTKSILWPGSVWLHTVLYFSVIVIEIYVH